MAWQGEPFIRDSEHPWEATEPGVRRKVLGYDDAIMMVRVDFEAGAVGSMHQHPHLQCTLVERGVFDVTISGRAERLSAGDCFFVPSNEWHGVHALEAGTLVDTFTPMRKEFVAG